jgi:hypothetical protein
MRRRAPAGIVFRTVGKPPRYFPDLQNRNRQIDPLKQRLADEDYLHQ